MPRFKQLIEIQQLMGKKEYIRNIGIIAHIDHGKTTLADSLLAGAGLLSPQVAGRARVLDFLEEEQKRKITMKTTNIALRYNAPEPYLINLVDTPGHVDFTGKVTRALRVIDGAVVVVDAVEEIRAQTESLTRQTLEERVCPVLFINKIDRLITELQLNEEQIQKKLNRLIGDFNDLVELYAENPFKNQWKISAAQGNVAFGAALYGWGFTPNQAKRQSLKFPTIITACKTGEYSKLKTELPVYEAIFEMAIKNVPNPRTAQNYRIEKIWKGALNSQIGSALVDCRDEAPAVMFVTNVQSDVNGEILATGRVFSGRVEKLDKLYSACTLREIEVRAVYADVGVMREEVAKVSAGNLVSVALSDRVESGETLRDALTNNKEEENIIPFEGMHYILEPVVTIAVEPKNPQDIQTLKTGLEKLATEDPNLQVTTDKQTGEYRLSGMGELHLEVTINKLKSDHDIDLVVSSPRVVYVECAQKSGTSAFAKSPDKQNSFWIQVEPNQEPKITDQKTDSVISEDEHGNVLVDSNNKTDKLPKETQEDIIAGFEYTCRAGPLCGEPIRHLRVNLIDLELAQTTTTSNTEIQRGVGKAIFASLLTANPTIKEPIYKISVSIASALASESSRILQTKRGKVTSYEQKGLQTQITGYIPVAETFDFSKELRSATSGRAVWQSIFDHWEQMPQKLATEIIGNLRKRKGLTAEVPKPEKFMEQT